MTKKDEDFPLLNCYLSEFEKLKDEQVQRISYRDNLVYATLVAIGAVFSYSLAEMDNFQTLLVLPLASFVLGWMYLMNDKKITEIGVYIRDELAGQVRRLAGQAGLPVFHWEVVHRGSAGRLRQKWVQLFVDLAIFVVPGVVALISYWASAAAGGWLRAVPWLEAAMLVYLAGEIGRAAEIRKG